MKKYPGPKDPKKIMEYLREENLLSQPELWRGANANMSSFTILGSEIRSDREPTDTPELIDSMIENALRKLKVKATRRNSIFVTGDEDVASSYGMALYRVFVLSPNPNFTWFTYLQDMTNDLPADDFSNLIYDYSGPFMDVLRKEFRNKNSEVTRYFSERMTDAVEAYKLGRGYSDFVTEIEEYLNTGNSKNLTIAFVNEDMVDIFRIYPDLANKVDLSEILKKKGLKTQDASTLEQAKDSGSEIYINNTDLFLVHQSIFDEEE